MGVAVSDFIGEADDLFPLMVLFGAGGAGSGRDWIPVASFQCRDGREVRQGRDGVSQVKWSHQTQVKGALKSAHLAACRLAAHQIRRRVFRSNRVCERVAVFSNIRKPIPRNPRAQ